MGPGVGFDAGLERGLMEELRGALGTPSQWKAGLNASNIIPTSHH